MAGIRRRLTSISLLLSPQPVLNETELRQLGGGQSEEGGVEGGIMGVVLTCIQQQLFHGDLCQDGWAVRPRS